MKPGTRQWKCLNVSESPTGRTGMQLGSSAACAVASEQERRLRFGRQWGSEGTVKGLLRECEVVFCSHCFV